MVPLEQAMAFCGASEVDSPPMVRQDPSSADTQPRSMEKDFDFVERPSQDFFCPVSFELLLEPQLTSCCGHHLSLETATRLQREGKPCPMCNGEEWSGMLDKYHRRRVHEVRVCCWHKENWCEWVGEVNELKRHADSCVKRPWECQYCALKCMYGEGEGKHWPTCSKFPEPCPNGCEVGSVERCNMEQHRSVCSLEPVACEMKEFGCSVVVPRKELATHMRESELQHLTAMTMLNLRLCRQLQQDSTERDRKMTQLQQDMTEQKKKIDEFQTEQKKLQTEMKKKMNEFQTEQKKLQTEMKKKMKEFQAEQKKELSELKDHIQTVKHTTSHLEWHTIGGAHSDCKILTFTQYSRNKSSEAVVTSYSDPFYSHQGGYKFKLIVSHCFTEWFTTHLSLIEGEYDDELSWPMKCKVNLELLNQAEDFEHIMVASKEVKWTKDWRNNVELGHGIDLHYSRLERERRGVQYVMNDCIKFRIHITVL